MKRKFTWRELKQIIELKTFYIALMLILFGTVFLLLDRFIIVDTSLFDGVFSALGITFITSSSVSFIMEIFLRFDIADFLSEKILSAMPEAISGNTGVNEFYLDRKRLDFKMIWENSNGFMKIIGISSNDILASANFPLIKKKLLHEKDFHIKVLLLCPWSITANIRSSAKVYKTKYAGIHNTHTVILDIENFYAVMDEAGIKKDRFELRLYDDIPSLSMIIDEDIAIVAPFMVVEQGGSSPYYTAKNMQTVSSLYGLYNMHFDTIWETAYRIDPSVDLDEIFLKQKTKDLQRTDSLPSTYDDWLLNINKVYFEGAQNYES